VITDEMMKTKFTLMHFDDAQDLLHGIEALQHYSVPICEVYTPTQIPGIETRLGIKRIRLGNAILKYGCPAGIAFTTLAGYLMEYHSLTKPVEKPVFTLVFTLLIMTVTFFLATRLLPKRTPRMITPKPNDNRYLIVVDAQGIIPNENITNLFRYAGAVEISSAVKNIVIS
jgi:hypothetical protein